MFRTKVFIFLLLVCFSVLLFSQEQQEDEEEVPIVQPERDYSYFRPVPGDQTIIISGGIIFPAFFVYNDSEIDPKKHNFDPVGGNLYLGYNYFFTPNFFVGGEICFVFIPTLAENFVYLVPLGARAGYQINFWRLEIPLSFTVGMIWHRYLDLGYYGLYLKAGASAYFRFNEDWSFGLNTGFGWYPEWTKKKKYDVNGFMVDLTLSVRYHF